MGRIVGPSCRYCRREGEKLYLKGERCYTEKCAISKKAYPPGERKRSFGRKKISEYGLRLREKQKTNRIYGVGESQFRKYYSEGARRTGKTGEILLQILERRFDNVVYSLGFATSRKMARQLVRHGHFLINGKPVDIPSYILKPGDVVRVCEKSKNITSIHDSLKKKKGADLPWLELDKAHLTGKVISLPTRDTIPIPINEQFIVEFYSR